MHVQSCCFALSSYCLFDFLVAAASLTSPLLYPPLFFFKKISAKQNIASTETSYQFLAVKVPVLRRNKATISSSSNHLFFSCNETLLLGNLFKLFSFASHSHGQFAFEDNEKNETIVIFFFIFIPKWQTSRANVMASLNSLNKLPNTGIFIVAEKWMVRSTGVGGFISPQNENLRR